MFRFGREGLGCLVRHGRVSARLVFDPVVGNAVLGTSYLGHCDYMR
jgi:hypothetical protein